MWQVTPRVTFVEQLAVAEGGDGSDKDAFSSNISGDPGPTSPRRRRSSSTAAEPPTFLPVEDLEPAPRLRLSPLELARLAAHCGDAAGDAAAGARRRRSSLQASPTSGPAAALSLQRWEATGQLLSAASFEAWCAEVNRVTRRLLVQVETVRTKKVATAVEETEFLEQLNLDESRG